ncbi:MAG TPA: FAD-binding oxidoreductase, partial [Gaiellales bacterium]
MSSAAAPITAPPALAGLLSQPGHADWDEARRPWNLAFDQQPAACAHPASADDVVALMALAREHGLRVAAQGTGHAAGPMGPLDGTLLVRMDRMRAVTIDPDARIARAEGGALWEDVVAGAAEHGLAALAGSSPDVGVVGYTLGGGLSWLGRTHGFAANNVAAIELVTADGRHLRADHEHEPDLFWALRGGGGNFGVVTAIELRLVPVTEVHAGILWWPIERGAEVLQAWRALTASGVPDALTTVGRFLKFPPIPEIPEAVRGKSFVVVEAIHLGDAAEADALLAPLRALEPVMDTCATIPASQLAALHMDPDHPVPGIGDGFLLESLPEEAVDAFVAAAGANSGFPLLSAEVRHIGGAFGREHPDHGAVGAADAEYAFFAVSIAPTPELG